MRVLVAGSGKWTDDGRGPARGTGFNTSVATGTGTRTNDRPFPATGPLRSPVDTNFAEVMYVRVN
jgi:hypothetical protein